MTGMRRVPKEAGDSLSGDTTFSGLPKAIKLLNTAADSGSGGAFTNTRFNLTPVFNYGGYIVTLNATFTDGVAVPEPGIYAVRGMFACASGAGDTFFQLIVNGSAVLPDGSSVLDIRTVAGTSGVFQVATELELKAGDIVRTQYLQTVAKVTVAPYSWLYVEKRGGQY